MENITEVTAKEVKKLTTEELDQLKKLNSSTQDVIVGFGKIEYDIQSLMKQKEFLIKSLEDIKNQENDFIKQLHSKYGEVFINPTTGEITNK